jgi:Leucine-rich repeat (LRR) protein
MSKFTCFIIGFCLIGQGILGQKILSWQELEKCTVYSDIEKALKNPDSVFVLDLSGNGFEKIPESIQKLKNLQKLILKDNSVSELPEWLFSLISLQELNLEENKLTELPSHIGKLSNLKRLNLTRTKIPCIPSELQSCTNLEYLNISWNNFTEDKILPIYKLTNLKGLNLARNQIEQISPEIANLINLMYLNLFFNPIQCLPEEIGNLTKLTELDLGKNTELAVLPFGFSKLVKLEYLNLKDVPLSEEEMKKIPAINIENIEF